MYDFGDIMNYPHMNISDTIHNTEIDLFEKLHETSLFKTIANGINQRNNKFICAKYEEMFGLDV